jgi:hypothetical protein
MAESNQNNDDQLGRSTRQLAHYTAILAVATIFSVGITAWVAYSTSDLRDLTAKQLEEIRKSSDQVKDSIAAANRQAAAAERANDLATQALGATSEAIRRQLRAYVVFDNTKKVLVNGNGNSAPTVEIGINLKNTGVTPAFKLHVESSATFVGVPFVNNSPPDINNLGTGLTSSKDVGTSLGGASNAPYDVPNLRDFTPKDMVDLNNGKMVLYVIGRAEYEDISHERHVTRFCFYYHVVPWLNFCSLYNESN